MPAWIGVSIAVLIVGAAACLIYAIILSYRLEWHINRMIRGDSTTAER